MIIRTNVNRTSLAIGMIIGSALLSSGSVCAQTAQLVVDVRADGLLYYYNPSNTAAGYVGNDGVVAGDDVTSGDTIGMCAHGSLVYTFGVVTDGGIHDGEYRVSMIDFSEVDQTATGNGLGATGTRNVLINTTTANLVDVAYDGTDVWLLADDGKVYKNSSTTAEFDFGANVAATYYSLTTSEGNLLAGATVVATGNSVVLRYNGSVATLMDQPGAVGGATWVAGQSDDATWYHSRSNSFTYEGTNSWVGNAGSNPSAMLGLAASDDGVYAVHPSGRLYFDGFAWDPNMVEQTIMQNAVDLAVVDVTYVNQAFPEVPVQTTGVNLIPNGDFSARSSQTPNDAAPSTGWNVLGSNGVFPSYVGRTAVVDDWVHYYDDPNGLIARSATDLTDTFYLDTISNNSLIAAITLNSAASYLNGMKQEDVQFVEAIDPAKDYELAVDVTRFGTWGDGATFTVALTSGATDTTDYSTNAVTNGVIAMDVGDVTTTADNSPSGAPDAVLVSGADLAGQINLVFDHVFDSAVPAENENQNGAGQTSQVRVHRISLMEVLSAGAGDVNSDGEIDELDFYLANRTLDGSIDGGYDAVTRQLNLTNGGSSAEDALIALNLETFDVDGDDDFDADDVAALETMLDGPAVQIVGNGGNFDFEWNSKGYAKKYSLVSSDTLDTAVSTWPVYEGNSNLVSIEAANHILDGVSSADPKRFFALIEEDSNAIFFKVADGSFEQDGTGWSACMPSWNSTKSGGFALQGGGEHMGSAVDGTWSGLMNNLGDIHQVLGDVSVGDTIVVTFYGGRALEDKNTASGGIIDCALSVGDSSNLVQADTTLQDHGTWQMYTNTWVATEAGTLTLRFANDSGTPWLDDISDVLVVPAAP